MTGTAVTEAEELRKIYKLDVVVIPTHRPNVRGDLADVVYKTTSVKYSALATDIAKIHSTGQPILVGTTSIEKNEALSDLLKRKKKYLTKCSMPKIMRAKPRLSRKRDARVE